MELSSLSNLCIKFLSVAASLRLTVIVARSNSNLLYIANVTTVRASHNSVLPQTCAPHPTQESAHLSCNPL